MLVILDADLARAEEVSICLGDLGMKITVEKNIDDLQDLIKNTLTSIKCILVAHDGADEKNLVGRLLELGFLKPHRPAIFYGVAAAEDAARLLEQGVYYALRTNDPLSLLTTVANSAVGLARDFGDFEEKIRQRAHVMRTFSDGTFEIKTLEDAKNLGTVLSLACDDSEMVALGLVELLINAIEHGNLEIGFKTKTALLTNFLWREEVEKRLLLPEYSSRVVTVKFERGSTTAQFEISDCGNGFDYCKFLSIRPEQLTEQHGRGILMARNGCFTSLEYQGKGNVVVVEVDLAKPQENQI